MRAPLLFTALSLAALCGCLRPLPEFEDAGTLVAPDAATPAPKPELDGFVPLEGATADLRFVAAGDVTYVSDGTTVWLRRSTGGFLPVDLTPALNGKAFEAVGGLWGDLALSGMTAGVIAAVKAGGAWRVAYLEDTTVKWSRDFPDADPPSVVVGGYPSGVVAASRGLVMLMQGGGMGGGPYYPTEPGTGRPTWGLAQQDGVLLFTAADATSPASAFKEVIAPGLPAALPTRPEATLAEPQCGATLQQVTSTGGMAVLFSTDKAQPARYARTAMGGEQWELMGAALDGVGRCFAGGQLAGGTGRGGEAYVFAHAIAFQGDNGAWTRRDFEDFEVTAGASRLFQTSFLVAGKRASTGQRGVSFSSP